MAKLSRLCQKALVVLHRHAHGIVGVPIAAAVLDAAGFIPALAFLRQRRKALHRLVKAGGLQVHAGRVDALCLLAGIFCGATVCCPAVSHAHLRRGRRLCRRLCKIGGGTLRLGPAACQHRRQHQGHEPRHFSSHPASLLLPRSSFRGHLFLWTGFFAKKFPFFRKPLKLFWAAVAFSRQAL